MYICADPNAAEPSHITVCIYKDPNADISCTITDNAMYMI